MENPDAVSVSNSESAMNDNSQTNEKEIISNYYNDIISGNSSFARRAASFDPAEASRQAPYVPSPSITRTPIMPMASLTSYGHTASDTYGPSGSSAVRDSVNEDTPVNPPFSESAAESVIESPADDYGLSSLEALVSTSSSSEKSSGFSGTSNDELISSITSSIDDLLSQMDMIAARKAGTVSSSVESPKSAEKPAAEVLPVPDETAAPEVPLSEETPAEELTYVETSDSGLSEIITEENEEISVSPDTADSTDIFADSSLATAEAESLPDAQEPEIEDLLEILSELDEGSVSGDSSYTEAEDSTPLFEITPIEIHPVDIADNSADITAADANPVEESVPEIIQTLSENTPDTFTDALSEEYVPVSTVGFDFTDISFLSETSSEADTAEEITADNSASADDINEEQPEIEEPAAEIQIEPAADQASAVFSLSEEESEPEPVVSDSDAAFDRLSPEEFVPSFFENDGGESDDSELLFNTDNDPGFMDILAELESAEENIDTPAVPFSFDVSDYSFDDSMSESDNPVSEDISFDADIFADEIPVSADDELPSAAEEPVPAEIVTVDSAANDNTEDSNPEPAAEFPEEPASEAEQTAESAPELDEAAPEKTDSAPEIFEAPLFEIENSEDLINNTRDIPEEYSGTSGMTEELTAGSPEEPLSEQDSLPESVTGPTEEQDVSVPSVQDLQEVSDSPNQDSAEPESLHEPEPFLTDETEPVPETPHDTVVTEIPESEQETVFEQNPVSADESGIPVETEPFPEQDSVSAAESIIPVEAESPAEQNSVLAAESNVPVETESISEQESVSAAQDKSIEAEPQSESETVPEREEPSFPGVSQETGTFVIPFDGTMEFNAVEPVHHSETTLFDISDQLQAASLAKDYNKVFTPGNLSSEGSETVLSVKNADSIYYVSRGGNKPYKLCDRLSFELKAGSICGLISDVRLGSYVTAREIAERCEKAADNSVKIGGSAENSGMLYIGSDSSIPGDITLKSYLVSVCSGEDYKTVGQRVGLIISQLGLGNLENTPLYDISSNKKILILMTAAALNDSVKCVIVNDPAFKITMEDDMLARRVCELLNSNGKCALLSCCSDLMISSVCNRLLVMKEGRSVYFGSFVNFVDSNCLDLLSCKVNDRDSVLDLLASGYPNVVCRTDGDTVYLSLKPDEGGVDLEQLINDLNAGGADTSSVRVVNKSFISAKKEVYSE